MFELWAYFIEAGKKVKVKCKIAVLYSATLGVNSLVGIWEWN
jgi:hypothetical protein